MKLLSDELKDLDHRLTDCFIVMEYSRIFPFNCNEAEFKEKAVEYYRTNNSFNALVRMIVNNVMAIVHNAPTGSGKFVTQELKDQVVYFSTGCTLEDDHTYKKFMNYSGATFNWPGNGFDPKFEPIPNTIENRRKFLLGEWKDEEPLKFGDEVLVKIKGTDVEAYTGLIIGEPHYSENGSHFQISNFSVLGSPYDKRWLTPTGNNHADHAKSLRDRFVSKHAKFLKEENSK